MPVAERQAYLDQVRFNRAEVGLYAGFVMQGIARMCQFVFHTRAGAIVRGGETIRSQMDGLGLPQWAIDGDLWSNANSYNSCSNAFEFENSFGFCRPGQPILYGAYHSDKLTWTNPINEGAAPRYSYHLDSGYSPTVQSVNIIRPHIEHGGEDMESMIYARGFNAVRIRDVISHIPDTKFLTIEGDYTLLELSAINYIAMDDNSFDVPESTRVILNQPSQGVGLWANPDLWSGKIPREVFYNSGVDLFGLGGQGIGVRTRNDGGKGVDLLLKNTGLFKRGFRNEFRGTNYTIREKDSYN